MNIPKDRLKEDSSIFNRLPAKSVKAVTAFKERLAAEGFTASGKTMKEYLREKGVWFAGWNAARNDKSEFFRRIGKNQVVVIGILYSGKEVNIGTLIYEGAIRHNPYKGERPLLHYMTDAAVLPAAEIPVTLEIPPPPKAKAGPKPELAVAKT